MNKKIILIFIACVIALSLVVKISVQAEQDFDIEDLYQKNKEKIVTNYSIPLKDQVLPALDTMFDCINQFSLSTYSQILENKNPSNLINCTTSPQGNTEYQNFADKFLIADYQENFKKTVCLDLLNMAEGNVETIPKVCFMTESPIVEEDFRQKFDEYVKSLSNQNKKVQCSFEYWTETDPYFACDAKGYYKIMGDLIKKEREVRTKTEFQNTNNQNIMIDMKVSQSTFETTQLKIIQKMKTLPLASELRRYEKNLSNVHMFFREFANLVEAFQYIFINASSLNCS